MVCKYHKRCPDYSPDCIFCKENGHWSYDKMANCYVEMSKQYKRDLFHLFMAYLGAILLFIALATGFVQAQDIYGGESFTFDIDTTDLLTWDVVGNQSSMDGITIYQDIVDNHSKITIDLALNIEPDEFTLIFTSNKTEQIIQEVYVSGGRSTRTITKYVNVTQEKNNTIYVPQNITTDNSNNKCEFEDYCPYELSNETINSIKNKPKYNLNYLLLAIWLCLMTIIVILFFKAKFDSKREEKEEIENA